MDEWEQGSSSALPTTRASDDAKIVRDAEGEASSEQEGEIEESFWHALKERLISWRSMRPSLRLITGIAVAQLLASGAIIALHGVPTTHLNMGLQSGRAVQMPILFFWASVVSLVISISFLMTGALMLRWPLRLVALLLFSGFTLYPPALSSYATLRLVIVALLWLWAGFITLAQRDDAPADAEPGGAQRGLRRMRDRLPWAGSASLPALTLAAMLLAQVTLYLALLAATGWTQAPGDLVFQLTIGTQLQLLSFALVPFLFLAGSDFAELGELLALGVAHVTHVARARRGVWLTLGLTAAVALGIVVTSGPDIHRNVTSYVLAYGDELALGGVVALVIYALLRWGKATSWASSKLSALTLLLAALGYFALAWLAITFTVAQTPSVTRVAITDYQVYTTPQTVTPNFSLPYPAGWKPSLAQSQGDTLLTITGFGQEFPGAIFVVAHPETGANADTAAQNLATFINNDLTAGRVLSVANAGTSGAWREQRFTLADPTGKSQTVVGEAWSRALDGRDWAFIGLTPATYQSVLFPVFDEMNLRWRPDLTAQAPSLKDADTSAATNRIAAIFLGLGPLLLGLALGFWLVRRSGERRRSWRVAGVFVATLGLLVGAEMLPAMLQALGASSASVWYVGLSVNGLQQAVAIATLALVGFVALRRREDMQWVELTRLALALNVGLLFVSLMLSLYDIAIGLSHSSSDHPLSWAEALIVLIALGWDLLMSGESFTNRDDKRMPRHTRLLLYLGYITLTATLVMFFAAQSYTFGSATHPSLFESEPWPQLGLQILGLPMVIGVFALAVAAWAGRRRHEGITASSDSSREGVATAVVVAREDG